MKLKDILVETPFKGPDIFGRGPQSTNYEHVKEFDEWMKSMYLHAPNEIPWKFYQGQVEFTNAPGHHNAYLKASSNLTNWNPPKFLTPESWEYICQDAKVDIDNFTFDDLSTIPNVKDVMVAADCDIKSFDGIDKLYAVSSIRLPFDVILRNKLPVLKLIKLMPVSMKITPFTNTNANGQLAFKLHKLLEKHKHDRDLAEATEDLYDADLEDLAHL